MPGVSAERTEVEHVAERIERLERAIDQAIEEMPDESRELVQGRQALRGVAKLTAVTLVAELGRLSQFGSVPELGPALDFDCVDEDPGDLPVWHRDEHPSEQAAPLGRGPP